MKQHKIRITCASICAAYLLMFLLGGYNISLSRETGKTEKAEDIESLKNEITKLSELAFIKNFMVSSVEVIPAGEFKEYFVDDVKTLLGMEIKFFYTFGKIHGYVVFRNNKNDFAIIDNATLKIILFSDSPGASRTFHISITRDAFRNFALYRGDRIIAFPVESIDYGKKMIEPGTKIKIEAECLHLKAKTEVNVL